MNVKPLYLGVLLGVSLVANATLVYLHFAPSVLPAGSGTARSGSPVEAIPEPGLRSDEEIRGYYRSRIATLPIGNEHKKRLLLAYLQERYRGLGDAENHAPYWKPAGPSMAAHTIPERIRTDLLALFGSAAAEDALFRGYFRPLEAQFPFLPPQKQVEVASVLAHSRAEGQRLAQSEEILNQPQALRQNQADTEAKLRALLTAEEYAEYEVRNSPVADSLRRLNLDLTEDQYRQLFAQVKANELLQGIVTRSVPAHRPSSKLYESGLSGLLGREQYLKFLRQVDPLYFAMAGASRDRGVAPEALAAAYAQIVTSQERIGELNRKGDQQAVGAEMARRRTELSHVFGQALGMMFAGMIDGAPRI